MWKTQAGALKNAEGTANRTGQAIVVHGKDKEWTWCPALAWYKLRSQVRFYNAVIVLPRGIHRPVRPTDEITPDGQLARDKEYTNWREELAALESEWKGRT